VPPLSALRASRRAALWIVTTLVAAASLVSFAESYRSLYLWARHHGLSGVWAYAWPCQVDVFIAVGELALFVALADRWPARSRAGAWAVTLAGLAVSVAGNVGHLAAGHSVPLPNRVTAAVPPLAAAAALAVGLGVLKRVVAARWHAALGAAAHPPLPVHPGALDAPGPAPAPGAHAPGPERAPARTAGRRTRTGAAVTNDFAEVHFAAVLAARQVPSKRRIKAELHVGQGRAAQIHDHLAALAATHTRSTA